MTPDAELHLRVTKLLSSGAISPTVSCEEKTLLFSEFFGSDGNIDDPYEKGTQVYEDCFQCLDVFISQSRSRILERLAVKR
jgi:hypothetical protein